MSIRPLLRSLIAPSRAYTSKTVEHALGAVVPGAAEAQAYALHHKYDPLSFLEQPIVWGDLDSFQHLNNVKYTRFIESSRMQWLASLGTELGGVERSRDFMIGKGVSLILKSIEVKFKRPVTYPDTLLVASKPHNLADTQLSIACVLYSYAQNRVVADSDSVCVWYDYDKWQKTSVPDDIAEVVRKRAK